MSLRCSFCLKILKFQLGFFSKHLLLICTQDISPNFGDIYTILSKRQPVCAMSQCLFIRLKNMILNARYTAIRVRYDVYTYVRVPILCYAFREFSTQNINRTIDWRDIGQCNLNGHKQKSKINKQRVFEFILTFLGSFLVISSRHNGSGQIS